MSRFYLIEVYDAEDRFIDSEQISTDGGLPNLEDVNAIQTHHGGEFVKIYEQRLERVFIMGDEDEQTQ